MRMAPSALASFGGRGILTLGSFKNPPGTPSLPTATSIPWLSAFLSPADASAVDSEFTSRPNAWPTKPGPVNAAQTHRMAQRLALEMLVFMWLGRSTASGVNSDCGQRPPSSGGRGSAAAGLADVRIVHSIERLEVAARVTQDFGVARMVGGLHRDDALAERRVLRLQEIRKLLFGLRRPDDQDLMGARE